MPIFKANAQKLIEKHIDFTQKTNIVLDLQIADSIKINTWNKNEVFAKASININENKDNEIYLTTFDNSGSEVTIKAKFKQDYFKGKNNCNKSDIYWEIYIPENTRFSIKTINGDIIIDGKTSEIDANTISGFIDLTVPESKKADLSFKTISGTIYSNHEFKLTTKKHFATSEIKENINGGGNYINLETISGDIYFRKMK